MGHSPGHHATTLGGRAAEPARGGRRAYRIEHVRHVVTVDENFTILDDTTIEIADGVITAITATAARAAGPGARHAGQNAHLGHFVPRADRPAPAPGAAPAQEAEHEPEVTVIDGRRMLALPGLVNLHTHLPMTLLRGLAENVDLQGFLRIVWAAEGAVMDSTTVHLGAQLGALESLLAGVTTTLDMYFHHEEAHLGAASTGLRHVGGPVFFDGPGPDGLTWAQRLDILESWPQRLQDLDRLDARWRPFAVPDLPAPTVPAAIMPHSTYTNSPTHLRDLAAALTSWPAGIPALIHVHVSENAAENTDVTTRHGATPTQLLHATGMLDGTRIVLAHGVHLDDDDRALIAAARPGASVAHCPGSNLKLASGALQWERYRADGIRLGLGTDGCSSSNDLDLWATMRQAALLARLSSADPTAAPARTIVEAATIEGARALGLGHLIGSIEVGKRADLVLLDLDQPHLTPAHDLAALLVFAAGRGDVRSVFVDGHLVVHHGRHTTIDTGEMLAHARERGRLAAEAAKDV